MKFNAKINAMGRSTATGAWCIGQFYNRFNKPSVTGDAVLMMHYSTNIITRHRRAAENS